MGWSYSISAGPLDSNDSMIRFSVIIPTRGRHQFLAQAVASVLAQTHAAYEVIIVDDGTGARGAVGGLDPAVTVLDNHERGPVPARNLGADTATGDCIAFLDDDDWWTDESYLATAAQYFEAGAAFTYADGAMVFEDGRPWLDYAFHADAATLARDNTILISAVCFRRSLRRRLGRFDETLPYYWDWDWYLRVARGGHFLSHIERPVVAIRVHAQNMSGESLEARRRENLDRMAAKHGLPPIPLKNHLDIARQAPGISPGSTRRIK